MSVRVALSQFAAGTDKQDNLKVTKEAIAVGAETGAQLVVTPENGMYSDPRQSRPSREYAESLDGQFLTGARQATRAAGVTVVVGMVEAMSDDQRASNTLVAIGPDGELIGVYRKIHLYDAFGNRESDRVRPAEIVDPLVFDIDQVRFGAMTCYDLRFPESARRLVDMGSTAMVVPAAWAVGPAKEDHWMTLVRARAIENTSYMLACGQTGPACTGQSAIVDPMGVMLSGAGEQPGTAYADLAPERVTQVRETNPSLANRRFSVEPT